MSKLTQWIKANCPGPLTYLNVYLQTNYWPTPFLRRRAKVQRLAGGPDGALQEVVGGPFQGMPYVPWSADKIFLPRLLGSYEAEIHEAVEDLVQLDPDAIVVAGAGEGYYAVGLARRLPEADIYAYDDHKWASHLLTQMIAKNGVGPRVRQGGFCSCREIQTHLESSRRPALICDVEGYEMELIDPAAAPVLARTTMIVELHDRPNLPIQETLRDRFSATHRIEEYSRRPRTLADLPAHLSLPDEEALWAMDEDKFRGRDQKWFYLKPHALASSKAA